MYCHTVCILRANKMATHCSLGPHESASPNGILINYFEGLISLTNKTCIGIAHVWHCLQSWWCGLKKSLISKIINTPIPWVLWLFPYAERWAALLSHVVSASCCASTATYINRQQQLDRLITGHEEETSVYKWQGLCDILVWCSNCGTNMRAEPPNARFWMVCLYRVCSSNGTIWGNMNHFRG